MYTLDEYLRGSAETTLVMMKAVTTSFRIIGCSDVIRQASTSMSVARTPSLSQLLSLSLRYVTFLLYNTRTSDVTIHCGRAPSQPSVHYTSAGVISLA